jgi:hypothetical protein
MMLEGRTRQKQLAGAIGDGANAPRINVTLYTPLSATKPVPVILLLNFVTTGTPSGEPPVAADILARGWGYATV